MGDLKKERKSLAISTFTCIYLNLLIQQPREVAVLTSRTTMDFAIYELWQISFDSSVAPSVNLFIKYAIFFCTKLTMARFQIFWHLVVLLWSKHLLLLILGYVSNKAKGQRISECSLKILDFPKISEKFDRFLP